MGRQTVQPQKEVKYSGVAQGPYKKWYDEWVKTPEGRAVLSDQTTGLQLEEVGACPRGEPARMAEAKRQGNVLK